MVSSTRLAVYLVAAGAVVAVALAVVLWPSSGEATFPGTNGRIFFTESDNIWSMEPNGDDRDQLTSTGTDFDSSVSADGLRVAFTSGRDGNDDIFLMDADGSNQNRLTEDAAQDDDATLAPDGKRLAFGSARVPAGIYVTNADGSSMDEFVVAGEDPNWSPVADRIVYTVEDEPTGDSAIRAIDADGGNPDELLAEIGANYQDPIWSPAGSQILFVNELTADALVMDADGMNVDNLTDGNFGVTDPVWSPDGTKIAFSADGDIMVMDADGTDPVNITNSAAQEENPDWAPFAPTPTPTAPPTPTPSATTTPFATPSATATISPTPTKAATPTQTPPPSATPTNTPGPDGLFGDMDCDGDVDAVDALAILRFVTGLPPLVQTEPCDDVGSSGGAFGDLDCDGDVDAVDALAVLRFVAGLSPLAQTEPCPNIGKQGLFM